MAHFLVLNNAIFYPNSSRVPLLQRALERGHDVTVALPFGGRSERWIQEHLNLPEVRFLDLRLDRVGLNPFRDLLVLSDIAGMLRRLRPDAVLACTHKPLIYAGIAARLLRISGVSGWNTGLGYAFTSEAVSRRVLRRVTIALYRLATPGLSHVFFQNSDDRNALAKYCDELSTKAVVLFGSGVDIDSYCPRSSVPVDPPRILMVSRLLLEKGIREFVEAAELVRRERPDVRCAVLGGHYPCRDSVPEPLLASWRERGAIEFIDEVTDIRPYVDQASIVVLPSYREGMPRSILEAMAMGRPVVTTDVPGCRDTVIDGVNGYLVPARDGKALGLTLLTMLRNQERLQRMGEEGRKLAVERFSMERVNQTVLQTLGLL